MAILRNDPNFPDNPATSSTVTTFEAPVNRDDVFGQRINGYVYPPVTGQYIFWLSSDDNGELWLSTNDQASNIIEIASVPNWTNSREWNKYPEQQSAPVALQAGQAYYIEALAQEGAGGDNLAVAWQIPGGSLEVIDGQYLAPADSSNPPPSNNDPILGAVNNQNSIVGDNVTLQLSASDPDNDALTFSSNGLPTGLAMNTNSGLISGSPTTAGTSTVNITVSDGNGGSDTANFSWTVNNPQPGNNDPSLNNPGNQTSEVDGAVSLQISASDADNDPLLFSSSGLPHGLTLNQNSGLISGSATAAGLYNVNVSVNDGNGGTDSISFLWTVNETPPPPGGGNGEVRLETWNTAWGTSLTVLKGTSSYPNNPDSIQTLNSFEAPANQGDVFGQRISGYLYPPVTGQYTFWIAADDAGELWLSSSSSPAEVALIASHDVWTFPRQWEKYSSQQSVTIMLQAGQAYYIEALAQEGGGGDHLAIAWQIPGQAREVIDGQYLSQID